ncbi:nuclear transport factor 2 family protein [Umezawaea beigongshangensis]|uniref:nuclear transport factor 2 family protein n=1 Tax=Umezawaea beigongshangensis TaxID=2780383 RepID=UPI0027DB286F|nr:nuclear transport factor 2 family protein [Umezawaea beigongshangensis]
MVDLLRRSGVEGERTRHSNTDVLVDLDGDSAEVSANQFVRFYRDGQPPHRSSGLRLAHTAVRTPAGWRCREAWIVLAWTRED